MAHCAAALDNGLGQLPPLGWNSWNLAGCKINETFFRLETVQALADKGFREAGYKVCASASVVHINITNNWRVLTTSSTSTLTTVGWTLNETRTATFSGGPNFPTGNTLGDFVHSKKGFLFGMYLSAGPKTCSREHMLAQQRSQLQEEPDCDRPGLVLRRRQRGSEGRALDHDAGRGLPQVRRRLRRRLRDATAEWLFLHHGLGARGGLQDGPCVE
jgi:hypothetical protein